MSGRRRRSSGSSHPSEAVVVVVEEVVMLVVVVAYYDVVVANFPVCLRTYSINATCFGYLFPTVPVHRCHGRCSYFYSHLGQASLVLGVPSPVTVKAASGLSSTITTTLFV